jgi:hypothetical protein
MDIVELIRNANSAPDILAALSVYAESLRNIAAVPDWCIAPLTGEADLRERVAVFFAVVNLTSQHRLDRDCNAAKRALRVFASALQHLNRRNSPG